MKNKNLKSNPLLTLFITFLKIGAFTFGGGYAMLPLVQGEIVDRHGYISEKVFMDIIAIAEATPGVIAVNTATFVGYQVAGVLGAVLSTLAVVLPSFVIISLIAPVYTLFRDNVWVSAGLQGLRAGVIVLIIGALIRMIKKSDKNIFLFVLSGTAFVIAAFTDLNVIWVILAGAVLGIGRQLLILRKKKQLSSDGEDQVIPEADLTEKEVEEKGEDE